MTTLIEDLQAILNPLAAGGSWYAVNTTEPPVVPYVVFLCTSPNTNNTLQGKSNLQNSRVQIDLFSYRAGEIEAIGSAIEEAMSASHLINLQTESHDGFENAVRLFRRTYFFSVWSTN